MANKKTPEQLLEEKKAVARAALRFVHSGMVVGLGTGTTAHEFILLLGELAKNKGLKIQTISSSKKSEATAREQNIPIIEPQRGLKIDLYVDGADEIGPKLSLTKGGGGALLREKVLARASKYYIVVADSTKIVENLGAFPLPVEVIPFTTPWVMDEIAAAGGEPILRKDAKVPEKTYLTDQQNYILDCQFRAIEQPAQLASRLEQVPGIVEHGLFIGYAQAALIAQGPSVSVICPDGVSKPLSDFNQLP